MAEYSTILFDVRSNVAHITLNRAENAPKPEGGRFRIPSGPGLGLDVLDDELTKRRISAE